MRVVRETFSSKKGHFASKSENSGSNMAALGFSLVEQKSESKKPKKKGKYERPLRINGFERESL